jgi:hypothetical protein
MYNNMAPHLLFVKVWRWTEYAGDAGRIVIHLYQDVQERLPGEARFPGDQSMYSFEAREGAVHNHGRRLPHKDVVHIRRKLADVNSSTASMELASNTDPDFMNAGVIFFR